MSTERIHRKRNRWKYHIVLLPHEDAGKSWTFRLGIQGLLAFILLYTVMIGGITIFLLKWTSIGVWIPVKNPELERRYGRQVRTLQDQLNRIVAEVTVLQRYNSKLRQALGSDLTEGETKSIVLGELEGDQEKLQHSLPTIGDTEELEGQGDETTGLPSSSTSEIVRAVSTPASDTELYRKSLPLRLPVTGYITRGFEPSRGHFGLDIAAKRGSPIIAAADGYILFSGWTYDAGYMLILGHGDGYFTFYKHNKSLLKAAPTFVKRGEPIALLGNTGSMSHGPHLHFEIWKDGIARDPSEYVLNFHLF